MSDSNNQKTKKHEEKVEELFHIRKELIGKRPIPLLPVLDDKGKFHMWVDTGTELQYLRAIPIERPYFAKKIASEKDVYFQFLDFFYQRALIQGKMTPEQFKKFHSIISSIEEDIIILATCLKKMELYYNLAKNKSTREAIEISWFVWTEIEYIFIVCRRLFDLLQGVAKRIWWKMVKLNDSKIEKARLKSSFAAMVLQGNGSNKKFVTAQELRDLYKLGPNWAKFYVKHGDFVSKLKKFRDSIIHEAVTQKRIFILPDKGFAVSPYESVFKVFSEFNVWKQETFAPNNLAPLRPIIAHVIHETLVAMEYFVVAVSRDIKFPEEIAPGYRVFMRGPHLYKLFELSDSINKKVWDSDWFEEEKDK